MGFLTDSAKKITNYFRSSPPKTVLGKRKTVSFEDEESHASLDYYNDAPLEYDFYASMDSDSDFVGSDVGRSSHKEVDCFSDDYRKPRPSTKRIVTSAKVTRSRNESFLQNNSILRKIEQKLHEKGIQEHGIQKDLEKESCQKHIAIVEPQKKRATSGKTKTASVTRHVTFEQTAATSKSKPEPALKPSPQKAPARKESAHVSKSTTPTAQWADKPNTRAREIIEYNWYSPAAILDDLKEPEYACRDVEIRDGVWKMMDQIEAFAEEHFTFELKDKKLLRAAFESMPKETVKIIGCVASSGPAGASGWEDLFIDSDKRQALVCAIIGNVIVEQVFQHMFFGGTEEQIKDVSAIQYSHRYHDGFDRNRLYADKIRGFLSSPSTKGKAPADTSTLHLPTNFNAHTSHIIAALLTHLKPILTLHHLTAATQSLALTKLTRSLHPITIHAGLLSLSMRLDSHTAYHLAPVFKEQPFTASSMVCINHAAMTSTHPRGNGSKDGISNAEQDRRATLSKEEVQRMQHDQGLVQITLFPGLTAYRLGGWETASSSQPYAGPKNVEFEPGCEGVGVRCRPLTDAWVYCRWGRQRVWQDRKPADKAETHGVAWKGGFVEFYPGVMGVCNPDPERSKRIEARKREEVVVVVKVVESGEEHEDEDE